MFGNQISCLASLAATSSTAMLLLKMRQAAEASSWRAGRRERLGWGGLQGAARVAAPAHMHCQLRSGGIPETACSFATIHDVLAHCLMALTARLAGQFTSIHHGSSSSSFHCRHDRQAAIYLAQHLMATPVDVVEIPNHMHHVL